MICMIDYDAAVPSEKKGTRIKRIGWIYTAIFLPEKFACWKSVIAIRTYLIIYAICVVVLKSIADANHDLSW